MRRSDRRKTKSLKAELEDSTQMKCKMMKRVRQVEIQGSAEVGTGASASEENEEGVDCHFRTKKCVGDVPDSQGKKKRVKKPVSDVSSESDQGEADLKSEQEDEFTDREAIQLLSSEGRWSHYPALCTALPGRERQIQLLLTLIGEPHSPTYPALHVYGHTRTGKTLTLQTILKVLQIPHAFVNCIECYSSKLLYKTILDQLSGMSSSLTNDSSKCDSMAMFIRLLQKFAGDNGFNDTTIYIVLDEAERLREMEPTLLPALLHLTELTHCQVCTVLVSELVWEKFYMDTGGLTPYQLHFPQYTQSEVLTIMCLDCPSGELLSFYKTFANHIWNVFQCVCRDLGELRHLSSMLYPKYCEPVEAGEIGKHETRKLWRHIEPYFRSVMSKIYLREISTLQWQKAQGEAQATGPTTAASLAQGLTQSRSVLELPHLSKYLLIAAYLASYNPAKTDQKFFSKQKQARTRKSKKPFQLKEKPNYQLLGPKSFPLNRLMAIFYSILEEPVTPSASIYSQMSSLVTLQLICQLHSKDPLDGPKYKCLMTLEAVQHIARTVGFDLVQYLYDFN